MLAVSSNLFILNLIFDDALDINDVVSSQGVRFGQFVNLKIDPPLALSYVDTIYNRRDDVTLATQDSGFNVDFTNNATNVPDVARRVEPRNSPTVLNAVYNLRNFWDGRADAFFNGVNPLGFRDPDARVKVFVNGSLQDERLRIPFSSLASQAVGPVLSPFEMHWDPRVFPDVGKKLATAKPLKGQLVAANDSLLGGLRDASGRGLTESYAAFIKRIFDQRFWGDGQGGDVCVRANNATVSLIGGNGSCPATLAADEYTLLQYNFSLFFGLAVQAYEATLFTEDTIVDLVNGGKVTGTLTNGTGRNRKVVNVQGLALQDCIAALALNNNAAQQLVATNLCLDHYGKFIHPGAVTGAESPSAPNPLPANTAIGGCSSAPNCTVPQARVPSIRAALLNIDRGLNRFFAGATGCGVCHFNPEFTGATVSALTGFGAPPPLPLPPGQERKIPPEVPMERMISFDGAAAVYDSGFYNLGVRPTKEDLSIGDSIGDVPLAFTKLAEIIAGGNAAGFDTTKIGKIAQELSTNQLLLPTAPTNLTPVPWTLRLACGPGLNGNGQGGGEPNNNPNAQCVTRVIPGERLLRNGAFKVTGLRNVKFTGPFFHNGAKMNLRQVLEMYKTAGHFTNLNLHNLDAGLRIFNLGVADEAALVEMMETGLTDWRVAYEQGKFDHPEICVPHGHDATTGRTILRDIPASGSAGNGNRLQTFEEQVRNINAGRTHTLTENCNVSDISTIVGGQSLSNID